MMGQLIKTGRGEMNFALHRFAQYSGMGHAAIVVHIGVAGKKGHGALAVLLLYGHQLFGNAVEGFFPTNLNPTIAVFFDWLAQSVWVAVDILHSDAFGADIAAA